MPSMSRKYCLNTSPRNMGFSQKASCKSQGLLKRTSKKNNGKYIVSSKYKIKSSSRNKSLYYNGTKKPRVKSGYGSKQKAIKTIQN
jgi:hypothetical protein